MSPHILLPFIWAYFLFCTFQTIEAIPNVSDIPSTVDNPPFAAQTLPPAIIKLRRPQRTFKQPLWHNYSFCLSYAHFSVTKLFLELYLIFMILDPSERHFKIADGLIVCIQNYRLFKIITLRIWCLYLRASLLLDVGGFIRSSLRLQERLRDSKLY